MRTILLLIFLTALARAQSLTANITEDIKMEFSKGKGSVLLKAGTAVDVIGKNGDVLTVVYRKIEGRVPLAKTDFKGDAPEAVAAAPKAEPKPAPSAPANPPPAQAKPAAPHSGGDAPTTNYGKMVKKAKDNEAKHKETLVDPANEVSGAPKK